MNRKTALAALVLLILVAGLLYFYAGHQAPAGQPPLATVTAQSLPGMEAAFNQAKGDVRLLVLLSPT